MKFECRVQDYKASKARVASLSGLVSLEHVEQRNASMRKIQFSSAHDIG